MNYRNGIIFLGIVLISQIGIARNPGAELIERISDYSIINQKLVLEEKYTIQINDRSGEKYASVNIHFSKQTPLKNFNIALTDRHGNGIRKIKKDEIIDVSAYSSGSFYEDEFYRTIDLKHNEYPYRVSYSYRKEYDEYFTIAYWYPFYDTEVPIHHAEINFTAPNDFLFRNRQLNIPEPEMKVVENTTHLRWEVKDYIPMKSELYSPPIEQFIPRVQIVPINFSYGVDGSFESWKSFGDWIYYLNEGLDKLPPQDIQKIQSLVKNCPDERAKVKKLYQYLQENMRYVSIQLGIGGLQSYPAEYVSRNKYGDCKALTTYMKGALKEIGVSSYYAMIDSDEHIPVVEEDFPIQQFNHVILYVPLDGEDIWLECTSNNDPFGFLGKHTQNRKALIVEEGKSRLLQTPKPNLSDYYNIGTHQLTIREDHTCDIHSGFSLRNTPQFEFFSYLYHNSSAQDQNKYISYLNSFPNAQINKKKIERNLSDQDEIKVFTEAMTTQALKQYGNDVLMDFPKIDLPSFELPDKRRLPVQIDFPIHKIDTVSIKFPDDVTAIQNPENLTIHSEFGEYAFTVYEKSNENEFQYIRSFKLFAGAYSLSTYSEFYSFISSIKSIENRKIIFSY